MGIILSVVSMWHLLDLSCYCARVQLAVQLIATPSQAVIPLRGITEATEHFTTACALAEDYLCGDEDWDM